jgi:HD-GYP domain-containing protein (c-di-GMP phosphodiesterase class II)
MMAERSGTETRLVELLAVLSLATDLGVGRPLENELRVTVVAMRFGRTLDLDQEALRELLFVALLRWIGCTAHAHELARLFDDEIDAQRRAAWIDFTRPPEVIADALWHAGAGRAPLRRLQTVAQALAGGAKIAAESYRASCEVGAMFADRIGLATGVQEALAFVFERWDGKGWPKGIRGEEIPQSVRLTNVAQDAFNFQRLGGVGAATEVLRKRSGRAHDPALVSSFCAAAGDLMEGLDERGLWNEVLALEPDPVHLVTEERLDVVLRAMGDFADLKAPFMLGHSPGVAELAAAAAERLSLPSEDTQAVRRAGWVHDIGRVGVPNGIWEKPGPLSDLEWERVRMHPYLTERALARCAALVPYAAIAALHHERLDGSGYHRGCLAPQIGMSARVLAAADAYHAMTEERPYRPALDATAAKHRLREEVRAGRLDGWAADAVLGAAGHRVRRRRRDWPGGLSTRQVEVLRLVVRGRSNREIAARLHISERTVEHHLEHIYTKIGVSTRAAAALFAAQNELLED